MDYATLADQYNDEARDMGDTADDPLDHACGASCDCDWYHDIDRDDRNDGVGDDLGLDELEDEAIDDTDLWRS